MTTENSLTVDTPEYWAAIRDVSLLSRPESALQAAFDGLPETREVTVVQDWLPPLTAGGTFTRVVEKGGFRFYETAAKLN